MFNDQLTFLRRDWAEQLAAGVARTPLTSPEGARWLLRWAGICLLVAATL